MQAWPERALGEICEIEKSLVAGANLPFVGLEDVESATGRLIGPTTPRTVESTSFRFSGQHILYGRLRPYLNKVFLPDFDGHCSTEIFPLKPNQEVDKKYVFYWLTMQPTVDKINHTCTGARMPRANMNAVMGLTLPVPPLPEQRRIVAILDETFAAIATAAANAEKNEQNACTLFGSYRTTIFTDRNNIWPTRPICEFANVFDGPHATPKTVDAGPIFLGISALKDGTVDLSETRHVTTDDFKTWTRRVRPRRGDVVFSYETRLGQVAIIPEGLDCCLGRRMGLVRCDDSIMDLRFFVHQYLAAPFQKFLMSRAIRGATVDRISIKEFPNFQMRVPPLTEQRTISTSLEKLAQVCGALEAKYREKTAALANLKRAVLRSAFAGELAAVASMPLDMAAE